VPAGSWYVTAYVPKGEEALWADIHSGKIKGFSMAGQATAEEIA